MKKTALLICAMVAVLCVQGQDVYWVTESNVNVPRHTVVRIYNLNQVLLAEYQLDKDIKFFRKRDKRLLNRLAEKARLDQGVVSNRKIRKAKRPPQLSKV